MTSYDDDNLRGVLIDHGHTVTISGLPGVYQFACSCGKEPAVVISRNPAVALRIAANHLNLHKPVDDDADVFEGLE